MTGYANLPRVLVVRSYSDKRVAKAPIFLTSPLPRPYVAESTAKPRKKPE